jgi:hypothetical protein
VVQHRTNLFGNEEDVEARNVNERLEGTDDVERGEARIENQSDGGHGEFLSERRG